MMSLEFFSQYFSELINTSMKRGITMDKPSLTIRPDNPVTPKKEPKGITVSVDMDTDKMQLKLRAIAKHTEALADELDVIDSNECTELSVKQIELLERMIELNKQNGMAICICDVDRVLKLDDELPTRLEGSD